MLCCIGGSVPSDGSGRYIKCVAVGDAGTGKTCLPISYEKNTFSSDYVPTQCCSISSIEVIDGYSVNLNFWDISGQEKDNKLRPLSYRGTDVFLVVFSLIDRVSYENVQQKWVPELRHYAGDIPIVLVGTMLDMREDKQYVLNHPDLEPVSTAQGQELKTLIGAVAYIECSARTQQNMEAVFDSVIKSALSKPKPRKKKTWKQNRCSIM